MVDRSIQARVPLAADGSAARITVLDLLLLSALLLCAAILRLDFMQAVGYSIDSDEAIVGLMAKHILEGHSVPAFYYGQHYMGSLEAIMVSVSFWLFGISHFTLQLVPLIWSLMLVVVMFLLGRELGGVVVGRLSALFTAIPPVALVVWSSKARGGFIEILVLGACALYLTTRWLKTSPSATLFPIAIGTVLGLGWWVNNQILYFMAPIALMSALYLARAWRAQLCSCIDMVRVVFSGTVAFFIGGSPYWLYNIEYGFPSLRMFGRSSTHEILEHLWGLVSTAIPVLLGAKHFWEAQPIFVGSTALFSVAYAALCLPVMYSRRREIVGLFTGRIDRCQPVEILLLFLIAACSIFVVSTFGWLYKAPRYLLPVYVGLFVVCAYGCVLLSKAHRALGLVAMTGLVALNLCSAYCGGRAVPGEPVVFAGERVARDHAEIILTLERLGISAVRTNYWIGYRLAFETHERVKFVMFGEPHQIRIERYEEGIARDTRDRIPLLLVPSEAEALRPALARLGYSYREVRASGYTLLYDLARAPRELIPLPATAIAELRAEGPHDVRSAVDGSTDTRWGSGAPQHQGMVFDVRFKETQPLAGIEYDLGKWIHDSPRGLEVQLVLPDGGVKPVLSAAEYQSIRLLQRHERVISLPFAAQEARGVRLIQTGSHPIVDWSIAELTFFREDGR